MGIWDAITDLVEAATPWSTAEAEAPPAEEKEEQSEETESEEEPPKEEESGEGEAEEDEAEEEGEEEEEEEEEEMVDPKEKLEKECEDSKQCHPAKHHYEECVARVTKQEEDGGAQEDCVEEFFHLAHCATQCAAPKLWSVLK